jgi:hypothetical protein
MSPLGQINPWRGSNQPMAWVKSTHGVGQINPRILRQARRTGREAMLVFSNVGIYTTEIPTILSLLILIDASRPMFPHEPVFSPNHLHDIFLP